MKRMKQKTVYLLPGMIKSGHCGHSMIGERKNTHQIMFMLDMYVEIILIMISATIILVIRMLLRCSQDG
jgi:hypothetical protein